MQATSTSEEKKVRLQIVLCNEVASKVERHAKELDVSQAWVAGWAIGITLSNKSDFWGWLGERIQKPMQHNEWIDGGAKNSEQRLQLKIEKAQADELEQIAAAMNQSPLKLAGLMIQHGVENFELTLRLRKTNFVKNFREAWYGKQDKAKFDDTAESQPGVEPAPF